MFSFIFLMDFAFWFIRTKRSLECKLTNIISSSTWYKSSRVSLNIQNRKMHVMPFSFLLILCSPSHNFILWLLLRYIINLYFPITPLSESILLHDSWLISSSASILSYLQDLHSLFMSLSSSRFAKLSIMVWILSFYRLTLFSFWNLHLNLLVRNPMSRIFILVEGIHLLGNISSGLLHISYELLSLNYQG